MNNDITIRIASTNDALEICRLVHELAEFENMADECELTADTLIPLMQEPNGIRCIIAEKENNAVGLALFNTYKLATFSGKRILYLEDLYVTEKYRRCGIGKSILNFLCEYSNENNIRKIEWKCLKWNKNAIDFYDKFGADDMKDWITYTYTTTKGV